MQKILFISRAFPPIVGGIENQNFALSEWLPRYGEVTTIANTKGKKALPFFIPWMLVSLLWRAPRYDIILLGDGVLALLGWWVRLFFPRVKVFSVIHGLDLTFRNGLYQKFWVGMFIPSLNGLIAVGNETITEGVRRGISEHLFTFIPNGFSETRATTAVDKSALADILGRDVSDMKLILRVGRFVPHKGVPWFIRTIVPTLPPDTLFIAAGGRVHNAIPGDPDAFVEAAMFVADLGLEARVVLLPNISEEDLTMLLNAVDLVVSPNIAHKDSLEGFGLNVIEAASHGRTVIAADYQGLKDAVVDGENGFLIPREDADAWQNKIAEVLSDDFDRTAFGARAQAYTRAHFSWKQIAQKYITIITT